MADKKISELTAYTPAVDVDLVPIVDTTTGITKHITWANIKATLKTYFDSLTTTLTNKTLTSPKINEDVALTATATQLNTIVGLAKATATENVTGTDDAKFLTALSNVPAFNNSLSRQAIINGNFDVWQRGTTYTPTDSTYIADRWKNLLSADSGTLPTLTQSRQVLTSGDLYNSFFYIRQAFNGAGTSLGVNSYHRFQQTIEYGVRNLCGDGKKVTVSFWARSDVAGKKLGLSMYQNYGSGGSPSTTDWIKTQNPITLTSNWTKYTTTFTTVTLAGKTFGTAYDDYIGLNFWYMWGSTKGDAVLYPSVAAETYVGAGYVDIAQVQLCAGDVALPFMPKSFEEELRACQRYCHAYTSAESNAIIGMGIGETMTNAYINIFLSPEMRTTPTLTATGTDWKLNDTGTAIDMTSIALLGSGYSNKNGVMLACGTAAGITASRPYNLVADGTGNRLLILSAEL